MWSSAFELISSSETEVKDANWTQGFKLKSRFQQAARAGRAGRVGGPGKRCKSFSWNAKFKSIAERAPRKNAIKSTSLDEAVWKSRTAATLRPSVVKRPFLHLAPCQRISTRDTLNNPSVWLKMFSPSLGPGDHNCQVQSLNFQWNSQLLGAHGCRHTVFFLLTMFGAFF